VHVEPIKPTLRAPGTKRLKLKCDKLLSSFAFKIKLRRYNEDGESRGVQARHDVRAVWNVRGRGLHSFPFPLNLSLISPIFAQLKLTVSSMYPNVTSGCVPKVLKMSSDVSDVSRTSSS
jgi:hypothetical protein